MTCRADYWLSLTVKEVESCREKAKVVKNKVKMVKNKIEVVKNKVKMVKK